MKEDKPRVIVKRVAAHGGGHGGGAWKIAYADFMTAMMAFFLVMWLLSSATPKQLKGIAEHFRMPLRVALEGGTKASLGSSVIPGGGVDPSHSDGDQQQGGADSDADEDQQALQAMKGKLEELIQNSPVFQQFRSQLLVDITTEGLRLQIVDSDKRPMFELASAAVVPHMRTILREIAPMLNGWPNKVTLAGHTDSIVYASGDKSYSNWELSADRANASRRELAAGGLADTKVLRVMGLADSMPLDKADPRDPINRRISIVVLNAATQRRIERENSGEGPVRSIGVPLAQQKQPAAPVQLTQGGAATLTR
jgi:chemotaxis protein MotB